MRKLACACLFGGTLLASSAALAQTYTVDKVTISGAHSVPESELYGAIQEHAGSRVAVSDIIADQAAIQAVLQKNNVVGKIATSMANKHNGHIDVMFDITDQGVQAPKVTTVAPTLDHEVFTGNKAVDTDTLMAASGLKPGEVLSNEKIAAAQQAILQAYKAAKLKVSVNVQGQVAQDQAGHVVVNWIITETKVKRKASEDEGGAPAEQ